MSMESDTGSNAADDVLLDGHEERRRRFLRQLEAAYTVVERRLVPLPADTRRIVLSLATRRVRENRPRRPSLRPGRLLEARHRWKLSLPISIAVVLALCASLAIAATTVFNLGKPTNATSSNPYFPLSGFHKTGPFLRSHGLPELLWIGTAWPGDASSDWERWPVVKALDQFGTFINITGGRPRCGGKPVVVGGTSERPDIRTPCSVATPDWTHAHYRSQYATFVARDLIDARGRAIPSLGAAETRIFNRYVRQAPGRSAATLGESINTFNESSASGAGKPGGFFPLVAVGGYLQTVTQTSFLGDIAAGPSEVDGVGRGAEGLPSTYYLQPLSFEAMQSALATGQPPSVPAVGREPGASFPSFVSDVNGEANIIIALICRADGRKPVSACGRTVIKRLLRYAR